MEKQTYTTREILDKYGIVGYTPKGTERFIQYMGRRGVQVKLEQVAIGKSPSRYSIISEQDTSNEIWKQYPHQTEWEFSNLGNVRNSKTKKYYGEGQKTTQGYRKIDLGGKVIMVHRGVMETFQPIENPGYYVVDHINGIRSDNNVENLRWVLQCANAQFADENNTEMKEILAKIVQKYGYQETKVKLLTLLEEITIDK